MKIAFVIPVNGISGGLYVVYRQGHALQEAGHEVEIVIVSEAGGLEITRYPGFRLKTRFLREVVESETRYDMVIATWWETFFSVFRIPAKHRAYFVQSDERRFYPSKTSPAALLTHSTYQEHGIGFITEARWIRDWLQSEFGHSAEVAPNGVDLALFNPNIVPISPRGESGKLRVLIEGPGSQPFKRIDLAFRVAEQVGNIEVWFVTSDGLRKPEWKIDRFFSQLSLQEMPAIYASCDVLLKLSAVEGFFGPPLEMMACGGTALVSKATGWDEYVVDGENALAVDIDDEGAAVQALRRLVEDRALRWRLSAAGQATARRMDWRNQTPAFEKGIKRLMEKNPQSQNGALYSLIDALKQSVREQSENVERRAAEAEKKVHSLELHVNHLENRVTSLEKYSVKRVASSLKRRLLSKS